LDSIDGLSVEAVCAIEKLAANTNESRHANGLFNFITVIWFLYFG
jgi:hypothetical protein